MFSEGESSYFKSKPLPDAVEGLSVDSARLSIYQGREALVIQTENVAGKNYAFRWYANGNGKTVDELFTYAKGIKCDEESYYQAGLNKKQLPETHFFITNGGTDNSPQLYGMQAWVDGSTLKNISMGEILSREEVRHSLADLFLTCARVYEQDGKLPDITGGDKVEILGKEIPHPLKVFNPLWTPNIMIDSEGNAVLVDARTHDVGPGSLKDHAIRFNRQLSILLAQLLNASKK